MGGFLHYLATGEILKENTVSESIHDKYLFKAVFMAGGGGSGKSFIADLMFKGMPVKVINADDLIPPIFSKRGLSLDMTGDEELYKKQMEARDKAKELTGKKEMQWVKGMLPLIIDGTGKSIEKIGRAKSWLENIGYDTAMVFVNTSLEIALQRNIERGEHGGRKVKEDIAKEAWHDAQENMGEFQKMFSDNFLIVDNSKQLTPEEIRKLQLDLTRKAMKLIESPLKNSVGKKKLEEFDKGQRKGIYLTDDEIVKPAKK